MNYKLPVERNLEEVNEEFNNFLHRVTEVQTIVNKLSSDDQNLQEQGMFEADRILNNKTEKLLENVHEKDIVIKVKSDRTILNKKALHAQENKDQSTMSPDAFMAEVSKDADQRYKDKLIRTEKMETFKTQATKAFRRGEYERALCCYNKAIEQIRDSPLLYNNRALTQMKLNFYDKAILDLKMALRLNESCLRSFLLLIKCHYYLKDSKSLEETITTAKELNPKDGKLIDETITELENLTNEENS